MIGRESSVSYLIKIKKTDISLAGSCINVQTSSKQVACSNIRNWYVAHVVV